MKTKRLLAITANLVIFVAVLNVNAQQLKIQHKESVHQYIVREAYKLLESQIGEIPALKGHLGYSEVGTRPWQTGKIVTGAWREDLEDVVYHVSTHDELLERYPVLLVPQVFQFLVEKVGGHPNPLVSITHFWQADVGTSSGVSVVDGQIVSCALPPQERADLRCWLA